MTWGFWEFACDWSGESQHVTPHLAGACPAMCPWVAANLPVSLERPISALVSWW